MDNARFIVPYTVLLHFIPYHTEEKKDCFIRTFVGRTAHPGKSIYTVLVYVQTICFTLGKNLFTKKNGFIVNSLN